MTPQPNLLDKIRKKEPNKAKPNKSLIEQILIGFLFVLAVLVMIVIYPTADGLYRAYKMVPLVKTAKTQFISNDFAGLEDTTAEMKYHLKKAHSDLGSLKKFSFIPIIGGEITNLHYLSRSSYIFTAMGEDMAKILKDNPKTESFSPEERVQIINYLANNSNDLKVAAQYFKLGSKSNFVPDDIKKMESYLYLAADFAPELPEILGVNKEKHYLLIFANNMEIRPGGGFIGSYGLLTLENGEIKNLSAHNSYELPGAMNLYLGPPAPAVMQRYLGIRGMPFRDSNWSPDYPTSVYQMRQAYIREGGQYAHNLDGVITISTEVLKEIIAVTGPVTADGVLFTEYNVVNELQKQVEIDFLQKGIDWFRRKDIVGSLAVQLQHKFYQFSFDQNLELLERFGKLAKEKHIVIHFNNPEVQQIMSQLNWTGQILPYKSDTLMIVDANLAGFKTEPVMTKSYTYQVTEKNGELVADLTIHYRHRGKINPLVHNYRSYLRVYTPLGSDLLEHNLSNLDYLQEKDRTVYGSLVVVPINGQVKVHLKYKLPSTVIPENYQLLVQKQIGAYPINLHLSYDFDNFNKKIEDVLRSDKLYKLK